VELYYSKNKNKISVMVAGYLPFEDDTMKGLFDKIENGEFEYPKFFSDPLKSKLKTKL
jgi:hypothetical protein